MIQIKLHVLGKSKEAWLKEGIEKYFKRLQNRAQISFNYCNEKTYIQHIQQLKGPILLDEKGKGLSSLAFSSFLFQHLEKRGCRVDFVIGPDCGFSEEMKKGATLLSLSPMTLTHQMVRLLLVEQLYRAFEIHEGKPYHKS